MNLNLLLITCMQCLEVWPGQKSNGPSSEVDSERGGDGRAKLNADKLLNAPPASAILTSMTHPFPIPDHVCYKLLDMPLDMALGGIITGLSEKGQLEVSPGHGFQSSRNVSNPSLVTQRSPEKVLGAVRQLPKVRSLPSRAILFMTHLQRLAAVLAFQQAGNGGQQALVRL